ncbi:MAG: hypothetical protein CME19_16930 [Gemmatimonadetes bacterium]|nr:hypothetical protein [Gemmatimonadota bacterium]
MVDPGFRPSRRPRIQRGLELHTSRTTTITQTLIITVFAVLAAATVLYLLGKNDLVETGVIVGAIVSLLISPISAYRVQNLIQQLDEKGRDLEDISTHDYLTGIYNRRFMVE